MDINQAEINTYASNMKQLYLFQQSDQAAAQASTCGNNQQYGIDMTILNDFPTSFTPEIIWLSLSITWLAISMLLTEGVILSLVVFRARKLGGFWQGMLNTLPDESPLNDETITRAFQGHWNAFKDLALFVPLAITIHVADTGNPVTAFACASYFWVQFLYIPLYVFKFSILTATVWIVGLIATCTLAFQVLV